MKKLAVFLLCLMVMSGIGLYLASGIILAQLSDKAIDYLATNVNPHSFEYTRPVYGSVELSHLNAVTWKDISLNATLARNGSKSSENIVLNIGELTVSMEDFASRAILISAEGLSAVTKGKEDNVDTMQTVKRMEDGHFEMLLNLNGFSKADILEQLGTLKKEMKQFSVLGVTKIPISFSATEKFEIQKQPCVAKFSVIQEGEDFRLVMDKNDLQKILALLTDPKPNPVEVNVIARNPLKAPLLLKIRDKAATTAKLAAKKNPKVFQDAYRHTLWSYLLTKAYGEQFAKEVTDAHEAYADEEEMLKPLDFSAASYQDLVNNAVGRQYAVKHYRESEILERVMTDPAVIKDNEVENRFDALEYYKLKPVIPSNSL